MSAIHMGGRPEDVTVEFAGEPDGLTTTNVSEAKAQVELFDKWFAQRGLKP